MYLCIMSGYAAQLGPNVTDAILRHPRHAHSSFSSHFLDRAGKAVQVKRREIERERGEWRIRKLSVGCQKIN